jgi:hypothetical protein
MLRGKLSQVESRMNLCSYPLCSLSRRSNAFPETKLCPICDHDVPTVTLLLHLVSCLAHKEAEIGVSLNVSPSRNAPRQRLQLSPVPATQESPPRMEIRTKSCDLPGCKTQDKNTSRQIIISSGGKSTTLCKITHFREANEAAEVFQHLSEWSSDDGSPYQCWFCKKTATYEWRVISKKTELIDLV